MTKSKNLRVVGGHPRPPTPPASPEPSVPPATTAEARTAFAEAIAAHLPGTWRLVSEQPDTITFDADSLMNTRTTWQWTVPVRLLKRDPQPGALLLLWTATSGGGSYGNERIVHPENMVVVGVVTDATTPDALGKAIESANTYRYLELLWKWIERRDAEVEYDERRGRHTHHEGKGFTAAWVAGRLAKTFLPQYLKALPKLRREAEKTQRAEAKEARERVQREEYRKSCEHTIADGVAKLRALGYESDDYDPDRFFLLNLEKPSVPHVYVTGHHFKNYVDVRVILRLSQLSRLLKFLGHRPPRKKRKAQS